MVQKITRTLLVVAVVSLWASSATAWSLNPFSSGEKTTARKTPTKPKPSVWDKFTAGTKNFFDKTGEALGLKKPEPKKYTAAYPKPRQTKPKKQEKSWFGSSESEEEKPKDVVGWMRNTKQITP